MPVGSLACPSSTFLRNLGYWKDCRCSVAQSCSTLSDPMDCSTSIRVFSNELAFRIRWPECWSFSFSISPCNEYSGLISFRIDWLDLLVVQGTLRPAQPKSELVLSE